MTARPGFGWRRSSLALLISLALHACLVPAVFLIRRNSAASPARSSIAVLNDGPMISIDFTPAPSERPQAKAEEAEEFVHIDQAPSIPYSADAGPGPSVVGRPPGKTAPSPSGLGRGPASFFGVPVRAPRVVYVVDRSLSMGLDGLFPRVRAEVLRSLNSLPSGSTFQIVLYNQSADALPIDEEHLLPASESVLREAAELLALVRPEGGTDHEKAVLTALTLEPDVAFLITDADDLTAGQIGNITRVNRRQVVIHTVDVSRRLKAGESLTELSRRNGGTHVRPIATGR